MTENGGRTEIGSRHEPPFAVAADENDRPDGVLVVSRRVTVDGHAGDVVPDTVTVRRVGLNVPAVDTRERPDDR